MMALAVCAAALSGRHIGKRSSTTLQRLIVMHKYLRAVIWLLCFWLAQVGAIEAQGGQLEQLLTKDEQSKLGVAALPLEKKAAMRDALIRMYQQGYRAGQTMSRTAAIPSAGVIETQVDGEFNGWEGETIVKLMNGQIWQQVEYHYEYHYAYMPNVLIYPSSGGFKMKVEGTSQAIGVQRLH
jgi:hypothetical protein